MGYVVTLARQYKNDLLSTDDLVSEGSIGLMKAADKFDPSRGKPFVTFAAPYIRQSIEDAISRITGEVPVMSTDESLPIGSNNNFTFLNVLEDKDAPRRMPHLNRTAFPTRWQQPSAHLTNGNRPSSDDTLALTASV